MLKTCVICGCKFKAKQKTQKYCSFKCKYSANKQKSLDSYYRKVGKNRKKSYNKVCPVCGREFYTEKAIQKYCSQGCAKYADYHKSRMKDANRRSAFYKPKPPEDFDWKDYGMPEYNDYLQKWEEDIPWYQARNSIHSSIDPYPI